MFLELVGTVLAGAAAGLLVWAASRWAKGRIPRWAIPAAAGAAMIASTVSSEYGWFARTSGALPETVAVAHTVEERAVWRPWTFLAPYVTRFVAVDRGATRTHPAAPGQRLTDLLFFGRWEAIRRVPMLVDCTENRIAALADGAEFAPDGTVANADWDAVAPDDPVLRTACEGG